MIFDFVLMACGPHSSHWHVDPHMLPSLALQLRGASDFWSYSSCWPLLLLTLISSHWHASLSCSMWWDLVALTSGAEQSCRERWLGEDLIRQDRLQWSAAGLHQRSALTDLCLHVTLPPLILPPLNLPSASGLFLTTPSPTLWHFPEALLNEFVYIHRCHQVSVTLMFFHFPLICWKVQADILQRCACGFLMVCQQAEEFWSPLWSLLVLTYQVCVSVWSYYGFTCYFIFPVSWKGPLLDNINEPDALTFPMPLCSPFSHNIKGSDDEAMPKSHYQQEISLMQVLNKEYYGLR